MAKLLIENNKLVLQKYTNDPDFYRLRLVNGFEGDCCCCITTACCPPADGKVPHNLNVQVNSKDCKPGPPLIDCFDLNNQPIDQVFLADAGGAQPGINGPGDCPDQATGTYTYVGIEQFVIIDDDTNPTVNAHTWQLFIAGIRHWWFLVEPDDPIYGCFTAAGVADNIVPDDVGGLIDFIPVTDAYEYSPEYPANTCPNQPNPDSGFHGIQVSTKPGGGGNCFDPIPVGQISYNETNDQWEGCLLICDDTYCIALKCDEGVWKAGIAKDVIPVPTVEPQDAPCDNSWLRLQFEIFIAELNCTVHLVIEQEYRCEGGKVNKVFDVVDDGVAAPFVLVDDQGRNEVFII